MIKRVCAAIIRDAAILMVRHRDAAREYWTLPGGHVEPGETPTAAVVREVEEEACLQARVVRLLWEEPLPGYGGAADAREACFLLEVVGESEARLGHDPEEAHLESAARLLQDVCWLPLEEMRDDVQVSKVIAQMASVENS